MLINPDARVVHVLLDHYEGPVPAAAAGTAHPHSPAAGPGASPHAKPRGKLTKTKSFSLSRSMASFANLGSAVAPQQGEHQQLSGGIELLAPRSKSRSALLGGRGMWGKVRPSMDVQAEPPVDPSADSNDALQAPASADLAAGFDEEEEEEGGGGAGAGGLVAAAPGHGQTLTVGKQLGLVLPRVREATAQREGVRACVIFRGLRVRMGIHTGVDHPADVVHDPATGRTLYAGPAMDMARAVADAAAGGGVLLSSEAFVRLPHSLLHSAEHLDRLMNKISASGHAPNRASADMIRWGGRLALPGCACSWPRD